MNTSRTNVTGKELIVSFIWLITGAAMLGAIGIWMLTLATEPDFNGVPEDAYPVTQVEEDACYLTYDGPHKAERSNKPFTYQVREYRCYLPTK